MSNGLFIGDKDPVEIRVGNRKATSVYYSGDNVPQNPVLHISAKGLTTAGIAQSGGVKDISGNGNNGTAIGGVEVVNDSEMGECFSFDGVDDCIERTGQIQYGNQYSFCFTIKPSVINSNSLAHLLDRRMSESAETGRIYINSSGKICFYMNYNQYGNCNITSNASLSADNVYHIAISLANNHAELYINGQLDAETTSCQISNSATRPYRIGTNWNKSGYRYNGLISDIRIYPYALTSEQVQALYRGIKKVWSNVPEGAILHLNAKGLTTAGIAQSGGVIDLSGNGNNGTAYGGVEIVNDEDLGDCFQNFNSSGKYILVYLSELIRGKSEFSCVINIKSYNITDNGSKTLFAIYTGSSANRIDFQVNWGKFGVRLQDGTYVYTTITPRNNEIFNLVLTLKPDSQDNTLQNLSIYINGVNDVSQQITTYTIPSSSTKLSLGSLNGQYNFSEFKISDFQVYPRALTAHEVMKLYLASRR